MTQNENIKSQFTVAEDGVAANHVELMARLGAGTLLAVLVIASCLAVLLLPEPPAPKAVPSWRGGAR